MDMDLFGIMVSMLTSTMIPRPLQCGQYPCGELNENECGAGSGRDIPVSGHTRCFEKCCTSCVSMSMIASEPFPKFSADITDAFILFSSFCVGLRRSITSSMKCAL